MDSRQDRERLKEEYKEHFRSIRDTRKKIEQYERKAKIVAALEKVDPTPVLDGLHVALGKLREKVTMAEARLEVYLDENIPKDAKAKEEAEAFEQKEKIRKSLEAIRKEMSHLETQTQEKAANPSVTNATDSSPKESLEMNHGRIGTDIVKTIGKKNG